MTDEVSRDIDGELDAWRQVRPGAYELARVLSLAARVEPSLVRRARLLLPHVDAAAEADLWGSMLLASHTVQGIVFDPDCAAVLRRRLAADAALFDSAWNLIAWEHRNAPWPVRVEERINQLTASGRQEDLDRAEQVLIAAARQMVDAPDRVSAARWVMRAFTRLPPALSASPAALAIHAGVGAQLDGRLDIAADVPPDTFENWLPWLLADGRPPRTIRFAIGDGFLEIDATDSITEASDTLAVPETKPLLVDVRWHDGLAPQSTRVSVEPGEVSRIPVSATSVEVRAIDGTRAEVRPAGTASKTAGPDFSGLRSRHRPFVGREAELGEIDNLFRSARVVAIVGPPGVGKTALLCAYLDRLESHGSRVVAHFLDGGAEPWRDPSFVEASLSAQLMGFADHPAGHSWSERFRGGSTPVFAALDGVESTVILDDSHGESAGSVPTLRLVYTADAPAREPGMARQQATIDLSRRAESNQDVCRRYLTLHRDLVGEPEASRKRGTSRAFLSYVHSDEELAWRVLEQLEAMGLKVWMDTREMRSGETWYQEIRQAIEEADVNVLLATPAAAASEFIQREVEEILRLGKPVLPLSTDIERALESPTFRPLGDRKFLQITPGSEWAPRLRSYVADLLRDRDAGNPGGVLLDRCGDNIGRLVAMVRWLRQQPEGRAAMARMPPTLYEDFDKVWDSAISEIGFDASAVLGLLAVAHAPVTLLALRKGVSEDKPWQEMASRLVEKNLVVSFEAAATREDAGPRFELADESMRHDVLKHLTQAVILGLNLALAEADDDEEYALRFRLGHLLDAGQVEKAINTVADVDLMTRICVTMGVDNLDAQLTAIMDAARQSGSSPEQNATVA